MDVYSTTAASAVSGTATRNGLTASPAKGRHPPTAPTIFADPDRLAGQPQLPIHTNPHTSPHTSPPILAQGPNPPDSQLHPDIDTFMASLPLVKKHLNILIACCPPEKFKAIHFFPSLKPQFEAIVETLRDKLFINKPPLQDRLDAMQELLAQIDVMQKTLDAALATKTFSADEEKKLCAARASFTAIIQASGECLQSIRPSDPGRV